ncbi:GGDEF domain-containing protein [Hamadaea tsunoensis]|uniref:GGDEF domain-containing protein n=1 Tax=Hamadaea tsunoensis TaxID=53368 RepID=UPI000408C804|nr:GGDEF domain-containing protein [Hamadaea tsunoensis]
MPPAEVGRRPARVRTAAAVALAAALAVIVAYPFLPPRSQEIVYVAFSWVVILPVVFGLRRCPSGLRMQWRAILLVVVFSAVSNTVRFTGRADQGWLRVTLSVMDVVASVALLAGSLGLVLRRGRNDYGGLIDAGLVAFAFGGVLWSVLLLPRLRSRGADLLTEATVGTVVLLLSGTLGGLVRLIETDREGIRALRWLLLALGLNLAGFVVLGAWAGDGGRTAGSMIFLGALTSLCVVAFDPTMTMLARPGPAPQERLGPTRLAFLGIAVAIVPLVAGGRALFAMPIDGILLILVGAIMVPLVMIRVGLLAAGRDRSEAALRHLASHDPLTSALNRRAFTDQLEQELAYARDFVLFFCDLDGFKQVNDRYGHAAGDHLLVEVAGRLREAVRDEDLVCRFGGDEFLVLIRGTTDAGGIRERIRTALAAPFDGGLRLGVSIGSVVSEGARERRGVDEIIKAADEAMYDRKARPA